MSRREGFRKRVHRHEGAEYVGGCYGVFKSSLDEFVQAVNEAGLGDRVHYLNHGESYHFKIPLPEPEES